MRHRTQADEPPTWPDTGRPNPWAAGPMAWPVPHRSPAGDVWRTGPDRFHVRPAENTCVVFPTLAAAVAHLEGSR